MAILGLDKQVDMILSSEKYTQFHKQLRRYCRNAALHPYKIKANQYKTRGIQWAARHLNEKTKLKIKSWLKK